MTKRDGAMIFTATQPFTSALVMSNVKAFKHCWTWKKNKPTAFIHAKRAPLRHNEDVLVFSRGKWTYNPQGIIRIDKQRVNTPSAGGEGLVRQREGGNLRTAGSTYVQEFTNYPRQTLEFARDRTTHHPTQKPVALLRYLIRTYSNAGETVLDPTMGSGSTGVAAVEEGREFIGIERDDRYMGIAAERIAAAKYAYADLDRPAST